MKRRQKQSQDKVQKTLHKDIRNKDMHINDEWLDESCAERMSSRDKEDIHREYNRTNRTKDMLNSRMHKIQGLDRDIRKRRNSLEMKRIHWKTLPQRKRTTDNTQKL